jgi:hypothetical protein
MTNPSHTPTAFWMPLLDTEAAAARRCLPDVKIVRRDDAWWMHVYSAAGSPVSEVIRLVHIVIQEELTGHAVHRLPTN